MCKVGQRCASHTAEQLKKATVALENATRELHTARESSNKDQILTIQKKIPVLQESVKRAQHYYDSTQTGMKKLQEQGVTSDEVRMKRASLQNIFGKTVRERKKNTGSYYPTRETITL